jgi:hypothetical protein
MKLIHPFFLSKLIFFKRVIKMKGVFQQKIGGWVLIESHLGISKPAL